ncbi:MerC domain-containing protein [[Pseudomonas] boreopolis]|uniref:MerC domain-containing protein n=1 Tax=Xanthomonas boreopolis TaxID=86183 RepID=UPI003DA020D8
MKKIHPNVFDASAMTLSGLCLLHCLALPLLASLLPLFGAWSEAEWVHMAFAGVALPISGYALWRAHRRRALPPGLWAMATAGLAGLLLGALGWPAHALETPLTVAGSTLVAGAHFWNWRRHAG